MLEKKRLDFGCALWGDNEVDYSEGNKYDLSLFFEYLICYKGVTRFYFPNLRRFNRFCWEILTELKAGYTHIKRIWIVRDYGMNVFNDELPAGMGFLDFDDKQYVKIENPKTTFEEIVCVFKSIMELSLFNIFYFNTEVSSKNKKFSYSKLAYRCCQSVKGIKVKYNLYVPRSLREFQPE